MNIGNLLWFNCVYYVECPDKAFLMWKKKENVQLKNCGRKQHGFLEKSIPDGGNTCET